MNVAATKEPGRSRPSPDVTVVSVGIVLSAAMLVGAGILAPGTDTGHGQLHAFSALLTLLVAAGILWARPRATLANRAPVVGLIVLAAAWLVESLGALGFGPDGYGRVNDLVILHDLGLMLTELALVVVTISLGISAGAAVAGRTRGRVVPILVGVGVFVLAMVPVAVLTGMTPFMGE